MSLWEHFSFTRPQLGHKCDQNRYFMLLSLSIHSHGVSIYNFFGFFHQCFVKSGHSRISLPLPLVREGYKAFVRTLSWRSNNVSEVWICLTTNLDYRKDKTLLENLLSCSSLGHVISFWYLYFSPLTRFYLCLFYI